MKRESPRSAPVSLGPRPVRGVGETLAAWHVRVKAWRRERDGEPSDPGDVQAAAVVAGLSRAAPTSARVKRGVRRGAARVSDSGALRLDWDLPASLCQLYAKKKLSDADMAAFDRLRRVWLARQGGGGSVKYVERVAGGDGGGMERARAAQCDAIAQWDALRASCPGSIWRVVEAVVVHEATLLGAMPEGAGFGSDHDRRTAARALLRAGADCLQGAWG